MPQTPSGKPVRVSAKRIFDAVRLGDTVGLSGLLKQGADLETRNESNNTSLHYALVQGRVKAALLLVEAGAPIDAQGDTMRTPLMLALALDINPVAEALLKKGADTSLKDKFNKTALDIVKASGNAEGMKLMFAQLGEKELYDQALWAIREDDVEILKFLVEKMGVKLASPGPGGMVLANDLSLLGDSEVADYVSKVTSGETARQAVSKLRPGLQAPKTASFKKPKP